MDLLNKKLSSLHEISKVQLAKILGNVAGAKDLTLQDDIIKPLERICGVSWLKLNNVEKIFKLEPTAPLLINTQFYMIYSSIGTFKKVLELVQSLSAVNNIALKKYHVICVPKALSVFETMIEELGLYSTVTLYSWQWFPVQIDANFLSMEIPSMYKQLYVEQDLSFFTSFSKSLWHLQNVFGAPKFVLALGTNAKAIYEQIPIVTTDSCEIPGLIIFDRNIDYTTALLTPATYTALLHEVFDIKCGICQCKEVADGNDEKCNPIQKRPAVNFILDDKDTIYKEIKYKHFTEATAILSRMTKELKNEGESSKAMALNQIKDFVKTKLQAVGAKKKDVTKHLIAAENIISYLDKKFKGQIEVERNILINKGKSSALNYLDDVLHMENNKHASLSLFLLLASCQKLTNSEVASFLDKYFLQFGYEHGHLYRSLINTNFIEEPTSINLSNLKISKLLTASNFYTTATKFKQIQPDPSKVDLRKPSCCSYVFGGAYIPLIAQILSLLLSGTPLTEVKNKLSSFPFDIKGEDNFPLSTKTVLVSIVGGVTYSELAACRLLEEMFNAKIIVLSDNIINGKAIADCLLNL